ncbi:hypothetical protein IV102_05635 [bacterium]|nr:hypothetical protein [bacterium]
MKLEIIAVLALPGDSRSDDIRFQMFRCAACASQAVGAYEESRRGALDSECWDHYAYPASTQEWARLEQLLTVCPDRENSDCGCCAHRALARYDEKGRWKGAHLND